MFRSLLPTPAEEQLIGLIPTMLSIGLRNRLATNSPATFHVNLRNIDFMRRIDCLAGEPVNHPCQGFLRFCFSRNVRLKQNLSFVIRPLRISVRETQRIHDTRGNKGSKITREKPQDPLTLRPLVPLC